MTTKALGASVTAKLTNLQKKLGTPYEKLLTTFLIERLVVRLIADKELSNSLVFKGGFVSLAVYNSGRYTIDLDALLQKANVKETLKRTKAAAAEDLADGVWFEFESEIDLETQGEYGGIRQVFRAGLGEKLKNTKKAQAINFDLGFGDPVSPVKKAFSALLTGEEIRRRLKNALHIERPIFQ